MKVFHAEPFGTKVLYFDNQKEFEKVYKAMTGMKPEYIGIPDGITSALEAPDGEYVILVGWFCVDSQWRYSTLAHECSHAAFRICGRHGVKLKAHNNETHAYLLSAMMDCFLGVKQ